MTITEDLHMLLYVALGGAFGLRGALSCCRKPQGCGGTDFPWHMIAVNTLGCILVGFLWLYYTLNCRILVGSTSFIGDSLEVLQPFLHLSKKECIFPAWGAYYGIPLYFPAEHAWYVCCRCRFWLGKMLL